jgi:AmmeMemoRadiSam system protein A
MVDSHGKFLLKLARHSIERAFAHKSVDIPNSTQKKFSGQPGVFVTLLKKGELHGSMGYPPDTYPLVDSIIHAARDAAFCDPRFKTFKKKDLPLIRIRIDILSNFKKTKMKDIKPGKDGILVRYGPFKALQLPEDEKKFGMTAKIAVQNTLRKAGLASEMWNDQNLDIYKFTTHTFEEK